MWGAITEFCKVFAEKHVIPSVIAVTGAIAALLFLPADYWMITKLGKMLFIFLASGVFFLLVKLLVFLWKKICQHRENIAEKQYYARSSQKNEKKDMEELWTAVDKFGPEDRQLLKEFLDSDNAPIERPAGVYFVGGRSLLGSNWVVSTEEYGAEEPHVILSEHLKGKGIPVGSFGVGRTIVTKYKLHNDIFIALKYSKEKYGKISHFE